MVNLFNLLLSFFAVLTLLNLSKSSWLFFWRSLLFFVKLFWMKLLKLTAFILASKRFSEVVFEIPLSFLSTIFDSVLKILGFLVFLDIFMAKMFLSLSDNWINLTFKQEPGHWPGQRQINLYSGQDSAEPFSTCPSLNPVPDKAESLSTLSWTAMSSCMTFFS